MIIKAIRVSIPTGRKTQMTAYLLYGRVTTKSYQPGQSDQVDEGILTEVVRYGDASWYLNEFNLGEAHYRAMRFRSMHDYQCELVIFPSIPQGLGVSGNPPQRVFTEHRVPLIWTTSRRPDSEDIELLPQSLSIHIDHELFDRLKVTVLPPF